jgi:hypothetical protein
MAEESQHWISAPVAFIGFTIFWAIICYWAWQRFGDEHPWIVLGVTGGLYVVGLFQLSEALGLEDSSGKVFGTALYLAIFGGLAWYLYPNELLSKPLASLTVRDLFGILAWLLILVTLPINVILTLRYKDD